MDESDGIDKPLMRFVSNGSRTPPTEGKDQLTPFLASLGAEDLCPRTVDGYRQDLLAFSRWYRESRGTELRWATLGSTGLRDSGDTIPNPPKLSMVSPELLAEVSTQPNSVARLSAISTKSRVFWSPFVWALIRLHFGVFNE
jgi:hypothetical protein